ncbi:spore germination protein, partial [Pseudomonas sp. 2822-15]|uniref:spore germination protein n=1 Tax=Pseudomonas sp. 2822-15 TaxID=1712677 RepID=UPI00117A47E7
PENVLKSSKKADLDALDTLIHDLMSGQTILFFHDKELVLKIDTFSVPERSITSAENETTVLGPQDSLTESLNSSLS